jgi:peptidoglycan/xylan/chitin deacetylase (PgdA/CDA1 family)
MQLLSWRLLVSHKVYLELNNAYIESFFSGQDFHYCSGPACQLSYGDTCDGNISPQGTTTKDVSRPHLGNVSYGGTGIYYCTNKNHVALTFDDGPYIYTEQVLNVLDQYNAKATFFITGNNMGKGQIDNASTGYPQLIKRMHASGHQIASHTWTHQNLTNLTVAQRQNQMYYNEMALRNILGFFPTYMRPPYSECDNDTQAMLSDMGYHIVYYNIDSNGKPSPELLSYLSILSSSQRQLFHGFPSGL